MKIENESGKKNENQWNQESMEISMKSNNNEKKENRRNERNNGEKKKIKWKKMKKIIRK